MIINSKDINYNRNNIYDLTSKKICIPLFQRSYAWRAKQVEQLIDDINCILDSDGYIYFLDFVYYVENNKYMIADGQQRLITISILIQAINDVIKTEELDIDLVKNFNIEYDDVSIQEKYKKCRNGIIVSPFKDVYMRLYECVLLNWIDKITEVIEIIKNKIFVYLKKCNSEDDAFQIFQEINTGGKRLTKDEIIKSILGEYSEIYGIPIDLTKTGEVKRDIISYYKFITEDFNSSFDSLAIMSFMKNYIISEQALYKNFVITLSNFKHNKKHPIYYVIKYINRQVLIDVLNIISAKRIDIEKNRDYLEKILLPLCMASISLTLNSGMPKNFIDLTNEVIKKIKNDEIIDNIYKYILSYVSENPAFQIMKDEMVEKLNLSVCSEDMKKAILIIDVINKNVSGTLHVDKINLEHVYPKKPDTEWGSNGWPMHNQNKWINNIGNMILLSETVNKSIQNQYITYKIARYKTIMKKDIFLQTNMNQIDFDAFEKERTEYILKREKDIIDLFQELPFGKVIIK